MIEFLSFRRAKEVLSNQVKVIVHKNESVDFAFVGIMSKVGNWTCPPPVSGKGISNHSRLSEQVPIPPIPLALKMQKVTSLLQGHLLDEPHIRNVRKGVEMNKHQRSFRQILRIIKAVIQIISMIIEIIRSLNSF